MKNRVDVGKKIRRYSTHVVLSGLLYVFGLVLFLRRLPQILENEIVADVYQVVLLVLVIVFFFSDRKVRKLKRELNNDNT